LAGGRPVPKCRNSLKYLETAMTTNSELLAIRRSEVARGQGAQTARKLSAQE
jgi:hypothetical protein